MAKPLIILGSGGHAKVVIATARAAGCQVRAVYDDNPDRFGTSILGVPVVGTVSAGMSEGLPVVIAIGDNRVRKQIQQGHVADWATLVHPAAQVHESVRLGPGTVVFAGVVVQPDTTIGAHAILNTSGSVDHDCQIGDFVHLGPGVNLCGGVTVGEGSLLGVGSCAIPCVRLGQWNVVGAGAVLTSSFADNLRIVGCPAKGHPVDLAC